MILQINSGRFSPNPLAIDVSPTDYGVMDLEGVTFNSNTKNLAVCGGKQVIPTNETNISLFPQGLGTIDVGSRSIPAI